uniref:Uncharacterized protein n=2 Tax=Bicosoecida sp. CB-2014 TaxID=1486930 RepID=A0A7S1CI44_9STRA|mmetsp:Transcript_2759/g.9703  ORF Transcript_2759/g.9703 Transcript_2759/m.9703 type:complete len:150 (+) Transcript_2759:29-478(+)
MGDEADGDGGARDVFATTTTATVGGGGGATSAALASAMDRAARRSPAPQLWSPSAGLTFALYALGARRVAEVLLLNAGVLAVCVGAWAAWRRLAARGGDGDGDGDGDGRARDSGVAVPVAWRKRGGKASEVLPPSGVVRRPVVAGMWRS